MKKKHRKQQHTGPPPTHHELHHAHIKKKKKLKRTAILLNILFVLTALYTGIALYVHFTATSSAGINSIRQNLGLQSDVLNLQTIHSSSGFSLTYSTSLVQAEGLVFTDLSTNPSLYSSGSGPTLTYNGASLTTTRNYGAVNFWTTASQPSNSSTLSASTPEMQLRTDSRTNIFSEGRQQFGQSLSDLDLAVKLFAPTTITKTYTTIVPTLTSTSNVTISNLHYKKVVYTMNDTVFKTSSYSEVQYVTVQHGRPYVFDLHITKLTPAGDLTILNQVIRAIHYTSVDPHTLVSAYRTSADTATDATETAAVSPALPNDSIHLPVQLDYSALKIVADNQPSVVRVASISCYDFNLLLPSGVISYSVHDACEGIVGSGSILSNDGYISTNGHVVDINPSAAFQEYISLSVTNGDVQPLKDFLHYLLNTGIATRDQLNSLITAINNGDNAAIQTLLDLTTNIPVADYQVTAKHSSYGIQLSDSPLKVQSAGTHLTFSYGKTDVPATLVGDNFDASANFSDKVNFGTYTGTDVALLKITGSNFPVISLGKTATIHESDRVLAVGWPGFVDGGLDTTKTKTIPTATSGSVISIQNEVSGPYRVIITDTPIAEGNSGGPAFNNLGQQIGLTTYAVNSADPNSGVTQESAGGILRTVDDVQGLLTKYNVHLKTSSPVNTLWNNVISDFTLGHFKHAVLLTAQVQKLYPADYLAASFQLAAQQQIAEGHDTTGPKLGLIIGISVTTFFLLGSIVIGVVYYRHHRHGKKMGYNLPPNVSGVSPALDVVPPSEPPTVVAPTAPTSPEAYPIPAPTAQEEKQTPQDPPINPA